MNRMNPSFGFPHPMSRREALRRYYDPASQPKLIPLGIPRPPPAALSRNELGLPENEFGHWDGLRLRRSRRVHEGCARRRHDVRRLRGDCR